MINAFDQEDGTNPGPNKSILDEICSDKPIVLRVKPWGELIGCLPCLAVQRLLRVKFVVRHRALPAFRPSAAIIARC